MHLLDRQESFLMPIRSFLSSPSSFGATVRASVAVLRNNSSVQRPRSSLGTTILYVHSPTKQGEA